MPDWLNGLAAGGENILAKAIGYLAALGVLIKILRDSTDRRIKAIMDRDTETIAGLRAELATEKAANDILRGEKADLYRELSKEQTKTGQLQAEVDRLEGVIRFRDSEQG